MYLLLQREIQWEWWLKHYYIINYQLSGIKINSSKRQSLRIHLSQKYVTHRLNTGFISRSRRRWLCVSSSSWWWCIQPIQQLIGAKQQLIGLTQVHQWTTVIVGSCLSVWLLLLNNWNHPSVITQQTTTFTTLTLPLSSLSTYLSTTNFQLWYLLFNNNIVNEKRKFYIQSRDVHPLLTTLIVLLLTALLKGSHASTKVGLLLAHRSNFGRIPFLPPPMSHQRELTQACWAQVRHFKPLNHSW